MPEITQTHTQYIWAVGFQRWTNTSHLWCVMIPQPLHHARLIRKYMQSEKIKKVWHVWQEYIYISITVFTYIARCIAIAITLIDIVMIFITHIIILIIMVVQCIYLYSSYCEVNWWRMLDQWLWHLYLLILNSPLAEDNALWIIRNFKIMFFPMNNKKGQLNGTITWIWDSNVVRKVDPFKNKSQ